MSPTVDLVVVFHIPEWIVGEVAVEMDVGSGGVLV